MPEIRQAVDLYKFAEIFAMTPEFDTNHIFLNTFILSCNT